MLNIHLDKNLVVSTVAKYTFAVSHDSVTVPLLVVEIYPRDHWLRTPFCSPQKTCKTAGRWSWLLYLCSRQVEVTVCCFGNADNAHTAKQRPLSNKFILVSIWPAEDKRQQPGFDYDQNCV